jgi:RNA polymerase sigma-70 factor (family 1)
LHFSLYDVGFRIFTLLNWFGRHSLKPVKLISEPLHNEKELLSKISKGDSIAFGYLFERYYSLIYSVSFKYLKVHELAEDMVQSSFLKIWEKRVSLTQIERFDHYLFRIARNEMTDHFRKNITRDKHQQRLRELFAEEAGNPEELLISKQNRKLIADVIRELTPQQQTAYKLSRDEGLSYQQIAEKMGLSVNTVKVHISLALKALRSFFEEKKNEFLILIILIAKWVSEN